MKKDKSGERFGKGNKNFVPRRHHMFEIGPNSHPRKVTRWLRRGGGSPIMRPPDAIAADHVHPRRRRAGK